MVGNPSAPYTDTVYKSFLFIDDCIQISQEHNKQKIIQDSSKVYSKVETWDEIITYTALSGSFFLQSVPAYSHISKNVMLYTYILKLLILYWIYSK